MTGSHSHVTVTYLAQIVHCKSYVAADSSCFCVATPLVFEGHHDPVAVVSELQMIFAPLQLTKSETEFKDIALKLFIFVIDFVSNELSSSLHFGLLSSISLGHFSTNTLNAFGIPQ